MTASKKSLDNLKKGNADTQFRSGRKAVENGTKGGKASGVSRRRQKSLQEMTRLFLKQPLNDVGKAKMKRGGVDTSDISPDDMNAMLAVVAGQVIAAANGNSQAAAIVRDWYDQDRIHSMENAELEKLKSENAAIRAKMQEIEDAKSGKEDSEAEDWAELIGGIEDEENREIDG